jgi:aryl-alcohol dehydrogenase-like predicted oxidoreductase
MANVLNDDVFARVQAVAEIAAEFDCTVGQFALAWCLRRTGVSSVIVGATKVAQIEENAGASGLDIPVTAWERADLALGLHSA